MGWFDNWRESRRQSQPESPQWTPEAGVTKEVWDSLTPEMRALVPWNVFGDEDSGARTTSGARVNESSSFNMSVVFAAVTLIADGVASLPPRAFIEGEDGERTAQTIPQWIRKPHPEIRRFDVFSQLLVSAITWGNGYAKLVRRPSDGVVVGLQVLNPADIHCEWDPTKPGYRRYRENNQGPWLTSMDIFHIQGPTLPGSATGMSVIRYAREAIGLGLTLEEYGSRYFGQGSQAKVVIELPGTQSIDVNKARDIISTFERFHKGKNNWHRPAIVSGGAKLHQISIPPDDAQFLQSRDFQAAEIARWFRVPPHRVGIVSKSTSWGSGLAEENMAMLQHTYRPWIIRLQDALTAYAPGGQDLGTLIELDTSALLQGTFKEQADIWVGLYEKQVTTKNETRMKLGLPKVSDGDKFFEATPAPTDANSPGEGGRTKEDDRLRKQEEASRADPLLREIFGDDDLDDFEERHLPGKHDQGAHGKGGGKIKAATTYDELSPKGKKAVDDAEAKYGVSRVAMAAEINSKITDENLAQGRAWYQEAKQFNDDLAARSGLSREQVAAITSATSPRTPWPRNKQLAEKIAMSYKDYDDVVPTHRDKYGKLDTPAQAAARKMGGGLARMNMGPGVEIARGGDIDTHLTGVKRRSFYNNMVDPAGSQDITVDTWMGRAAMNTSTKGMSLDDSKDFIGAADKVTGGGAGYVSISESVRMVAKERGLSPHEVQAAYWIAVSGSKDGAWGRE